MDWTAVGVIVTGLALTVTIAFFIIESARDRRAAREANHRALVGRVIDSVERAARAHTKFPFGHVLSSAEFELAIAFPRLLVELNHDEQPVALWVGKQVQLMRAAPRAKDANQLAVEIAFKLATWHSGTTPLSWFSDQLEATPIDLDFRVPLKARVSRQFWLSWEVAKVTAVSAGALLAFRHVIRVAEE